MNATGDSARILVVDDEPIVAEYLEEVLTALGYEVVGVASSGSEAVQKAADALPDLTLMDINLPGGMDGIEAASVIRSENDIPVVFVTGHADDATLKRAKITGPYGYILKPPKEGELRAAIEVALYKHQMERQLHDSEQRLSTILTSIGDGVVAAGPDGTVEFMNPAAETMTGWGRELAQGVPLPQVVVLSNNGGVPLEEHPAMRAVRQAETTDLGYPAKVVSQEGKLTPVDGAASPLVDIRGEVSGAVLTLRDVSERRRAEALWASQQFLQSIVDAQAAHTAILDEEGTLIAVNEAWCRLAEEDRWTDPACGLGRHFRAVYESMCSPHPEDARAVVSAVESVLSGDAERVDLEYLCRARGAERWFQVRVAGFEGPDQGCVVVAHDDITERKRTEQSLRQYAERLRVLREIDQAILSAHSPESIAQEALRHIQGVVPCCYSSVTAFDEAPVRARVLAGQAGTPGAPQSGAEFSVDSFGALESLRDGTPQTGTTSPAQEGRSPLEDALADAGVQSYLHIPLIALGNLIHPGALVGCLTLGRETPAPFAHADLEIAKEVAAPLAIALQQSRLYEQAQQHASELEERVDERTAELRETNAELESFSYSVSHDLRTPLWAIKVFADEIRQQSEGRLDDDLQHYVERITNCATQMEELIEDLLAYSRLSRSELHLSLVPLDGVIAEVLQRLEVELDSREARVSVLEPLPVVEGHHATLVQIVSNLLTNAVKFVSPDVRPEVRIRAEAAGERVRLWVEDNGIGVDPEHRERIFRVFERLHGGEDYAGTGIGLAIVRKGVARMDGRAGVESVPGSGSRFWVDLARAEEHE